MKKLFVTAVAMMLFAATLNAETNDSKQLTNARPGITANTKFVWLLKIKSKKIQQAFYAIDLTYEVNEFFGKEMYERVSAHYYVFNKNNKVIGYMRAALFSTDDEPELYHYIATYVDKSGMRVGGIYNLGQYSSKDKNKLMELPYELWAGVFE